jgi:transposase
MPLEEVHMPRKKRLHKFNDEFKEEAVRLVLESDKSVRQIAFDLGVSPSTLNNWVRMERFRQGVRTENGLTTEEQRELKRLRKENEQLRMERDILKKAAAFFAKENE